MEAVVNGLVAGHRLKRQLFEAGDSDQMRKSE